MPPRRILSLWFPRLAAEQRIRRMPELGGQPFAVVGEARGALVLASLSVEAEAIGLRLGLGLADARAIVPDLLTRFADPVREAAFLRGLARWAERLAPWVSVEGRDGLVLDITGSAHLFGGEAELVTKAAKDIDDLGLTVRAGLADTVGAAWAVARYGAYAEILAPVGNAIDSESRATRSRAVRRTEPAVRLDNATMVVPPGEARAALATLPVAALRIGPGAVATLSELGLRQIEDVAAIPRAQLARRLGVDVVRRIDQALGREPEPVAAARPGPGFRVRLTAPEPIGMEADVISGLWRLAAALGERLKKAGMGARRVRAVLERAEGDAERVDAGYARPVDDADAIMRVLGLKVAGIEAGFGFDVLRLAAVEVEPQGTAAPQGGRPQEERISDLIGRLGGRVGLEALVRLRPAESHLPEEGTAEVAAGFALAAEAWLKRGLKRPILLMPPEPIMPEDEESPPRAFRWRQRRVMRATAVGPERIAPEWWRESPVWRFGLRSYWRVETTTGERLWLFKATRSGGWFVHGLFD